MEKATVAIIIATREMNSDLDIVWEGLGVIGILMRDVWVRQLDPYEVSLARRYHDCKEETMA